MNTTENPEESKAQGQENQAPSNETDKISIESTESLTDDKSESKDKVAEDKSVSPDSPEEAKAIQEEVVNSEPVPEVKKSMFKRFLGSLYRFFKNTHNGYILALFLALFLAIGYFMHRKQISTINSEHTAQMEELSIRSKKQMEAQNKNSIHQIAAPFSWAVRSELLRKNNEIVDQYMIELVKQPNFESIYIIDNQGKIMLSSDKKYQDREFKSLKDQKYLKYESIFVEVISDSVYYCAAPLLGFDNRIGTVFFEYHPKVIDVKKLLGQVENDLNGTEQK